MSLSMTRAEREEFLTAARIAVISVSDPGRGPLTLPIWYRYEAGGDIFFVTGGMSKKAELIRKAGRLSLCVQTETVPYQYVSIEGPIAITEPDYDRDIRAVAQRYLGDEMAAMYLQATAEERAESASILVRLRPERWITVDYGKQF